ncbi:MAG: hypothetical protein JKX76_03335 [Colwellia sp.]|nr:hypothetical protein [Colwellia sp.]
MKEILIKANEQQLKHGANLGWVFPLNLPYPEYKRIVSLHEESPDILDRYFIGFFSSNFEGNIKTPILKYSLSIPEYLKTLLNECFSSYSNNHYQICVPALFAVIEGLLVDLSNNGDRKNTRYKQGISNYIESSNIKVEVMPLLSLYHFLELAFTPSDFNGVEVDVINRHWSQHGRYLYDLTNKAPLQLFNAIALILFTHDFLKNHEWGEKLSEDGSVMIAPKSQLDAINVTENSIVSY